MEGGMRTGLIFLILAPVALSGSGPTVSTNNNRAEKPVMSRWVDSGMPMSASTYIRLMIEGKSPAWVNTSHPERVSRPIKLSSDTS
jgi:hypothetical protein